MWADDLRVKAENDSHRIKFTIFVCILCGLFLLMLMGIYLGVCLFQDYLVKNAYFYGLMGAVFIDALIILALCWAHKLKTSRWPLEDFGPWWPWRSEKEAMRMDFDIEVG